MKAKKIILNILKTIALPFCLYAILCIINPGSFLSFKSLLMMVTQSIPYLVIGWSMLFGMSVGLFDFSAGARILFAGLIAIRCGQLFGFAGFIIGAIVASVILGALVGLAYSALRIPSIIAGFAALLIFEALGVNYQNSFTVTTNSDFFILAQSPYVYVLAVVVYILMYLIINKTKFGYQIMAIGGDEKIALSMGINSKKLKLLTYIVGGAFTGIATILYVSNNGTVYVNSGMASMSLCFTPMMAVMIGQFYKSCNPVIGVFVGQFCITVISSGMIALNLPFLLQNVLIGSFLIIFMMIQINRVSIKKGLNTLNMKLKMMFGKKEKTA